MNILHKHTPARPATASENRKRLESRKRFSLSRIAAITLVLLALGMVSAGAQTVKIASIAPESTPWGEGLNRMAAEWSQITNGRVRVRVFHGGVAGDEQDFVRKIRLGQLQGAAVTTVGLTTVVPELWGMVMPGVIESDEELNYVLDSLEEDLDRSFRDEGYEILTWSNAGWLKFFSTQEIRSPEDLGGLKVATGDFVEDINEVMRGMGMQPVPLSSPEILSGLNSGLIDSVLYAPLGVAGFQWFGVTNQMLDLPVAPFFGAIYIDERTWRRIPEQYHEELMESAERIGVEIESKLAGLEEDALELMQEYGLEIISISSQQEDQWYEVFEQKRDELNSSYFENDLISKMTDLLDDFRENN